MATTPPDTTPRDTASSSRFRITRAGVLNVWQYDEQVFDFADGRLLLRGANGAGKSKTMEMLLPFVIDGDKARLTASGRHHTSLLWLMLDGYDGASRTGYLWVEFVRARADGTEEALTCGVGLRATASARVASAWFFTSPRRVGEELELENEAGPLSQTALAAEIETRDGGRGHVFENPRRYRQHVGALLFGLPLEQYETLLRLIYWLRQPQVGEDIDPKRLAEQLVNALPVIDPDTLSSAGSTFDELQAFGEEIDRRERSAAALADFVTTYAGYARALVAERGNRALAAAKAATDAGRKLVRTRRELSEADSALAGATQASEQAAAERRDAEARIATLESSPQARSRQHLFELGKRVQTLAAVAEDAARDVERAGRRADASAGQAEAAAESVHRAAGRVHTTSADAAAALAGCDLSAPAAPAAAGRVTQPSWRPPADLDAVSAGIGEAGRKHEEWARTSGRLVGELTAAIQVVEEARRVAEHAHDQAERAQRVVDATEARAESARASLRATEESARSAESALVAGLSAWQQADAAVPVALPELTRDGLALLETLAAAAAAPAQQLLTEARAAARLRVVAADSAIAELTAQRRAIESEADPAPPPPLWRRDPRTDLDGAPFWRLVDFRVDLALQERAGLEAALEGAGLLDAWITPDGRVLDGDRHDVVLAVAASSPDGEGLGATEEPSESPEAGGGAGETVRSAGDRDDRPADEPSTSGSDLRALLVADAASAPLVAPVVVDAVLATVALADQARPESTLRVGADGRWRVGPSHGRTSKPSAQFIGASARAAERARRVAELDERLVEQRAQRVAARGDEQQAADRLADLAGWLASRPRHDDVLMAWSLEDARRDALASVESELSEAVEVARATRHEAAARHAELAALAERHRLPTTVDGLRARAERARGADEALSLVLRAQDALDAALQMWRDRADRGQADTQDLVERRARHEASQHEWQAANTEHEELTRAQGADVAELERRLSEHRAAAAAAAEALSRHTSEREALIGRKGGLEHGVEADREALVTTEGHRDAASDELRSLHAVPGLMRAADLGVDPAGLSADLDEVRRLVERATAGPHRSANDVLQAITQLQSSPASITEPRLVEADGAYAAVGRDDATGDVPLPVLASRMAASVAADRGLLTERERTLFETHVLGQLGDALRSVRRQAQELVTAMNDQLKRVSTSQGIRVRLRWRLRDDIPSDARRAVELLGQPLAALVADERAELREALHRLIDLSRAEAPQDSYTEHLARALDYRQWFAFAVQYHRPEAGDWRDLHRKSALSQGEQKVLCYLPLFAAAAAHFTSVAGAAPYAPRFVLLDDAFPKIDVRTHPLLFGLLVDLDLDFVVTSERLWGTHATVPSLAIYEALRNPAQRGIAQYEHRWDGHQLTAVGARD